MGSHIDCVIPKDRNFPIEKVEEKLNSVFKLSESDHSHIKQYGRFGQDRSDHWWVHKAEAHSYYPEYILGEGSIFSISIYDKVVHFSCIERFGSLYLEDSEISRQLIRMLNGLCSIFNKSDEMLIGCGGFGDTDHILEMAATGKSFVEICAKMKELNGRPANEFEELREDGKFWYLRIEN